MTFLSEHRPLQPSSRPLRWVTGTSASGQELPRALRLVLSRFRQLPEGTPQSPCEAARGGNPAVPSY